MSINNFCGEEREEWKMREEPWQEQENKSNKVLIMITMMMSDDQDNYMEISILPHCSFVCIYKLQEQTIKKGHKKMIVQVGERNGVVGEF